MAEANLTVLRDPGARAHEADSPHSPVVYFGPDKPLRLDAGVELTPFQIAYQTYGTLDAARANAVLICHALTGDQHVANVHPVTGKPGWWETMVGPAHPRPIRRPASRGVSTFRSPPCATWCAHRRCCSTTSASSRCSP
jgi:hypothetical protein